MNCSLSQSDAAYVLGALAPSERREFEEHLPDCQACSASLRELAGLPGLLARVDPDDLGRREADLPTPPPSVLPNLVRMAARERRRRQVMVGLSAAAAALLIGGIGYGLGAGAGADAPSSISAAATPLLHMLPVGQQVVTADVGLASVPWGTRLDLTCSYVDDVDHHASESYPEAGPSYSLVVRTRAGQLEQVATWHALYGRTMQISAATSTSRTDIAGVEVHDAEGKVVLAVTS